MKLLRSLLSALRLAGLAIVRAKLRATLTVLGILIGIAAVVIVTALGQGAQAQIGAQMDSLGANIIYINPQSTQTSGAKSKASGRLTEADGKAVVAGATSISNCAPFLSSAGQIIAGDRNVSTSIMGVTRPYFSVRDFKVDRGSMWSEADERAKAKVAIIGTTVSESLFGSQDPVGETIRIGRYPYRIVALLAKKGTDPFGEDQDDRVLMPSDSFRARVRPTPPGRVDMLMCSASDVRTVERAQKQITSILRQRHGFDDIREPDFRIQTQAEFRKGQETILAVLSVLLVAVAAVSLFVGGIGVMNIMLVSVTERTREIGIRMAIGASEADILLQFIVEAIMLSLLGGIAGSVLGVGAVFGLAKAIGWQLFMPVEALVAALTVSAVIGLVFGFLPARRAARLDPIDALRDE